MAIDDGYGGGGVQVPPTPQPVQTPPAMAGAAGGGGNAVSPDMQAMMAFAAQQAQLQMAAMGFGSDSDASVRSTDTIWYADILLGRNERRPVIPGEGPDGAMRVMPGLAQGSTERRSTPEDLMKQWYADEKFQDQWSQRMRDAGWIDEDTDAFQENQTFQNFLLEAGAFSYANPDLSLDEIYDRMKGEDKDDGTGAASAAARTPQVGDQQVSTNRSTSVDLTNPTEAKRLINTILADYLGGDASKAQFNEFLEVLHRSQEENPTVNESTSTQTITSVDEDGYDTSTETSATTSGGVDAQQIAMDYAKELPEYSRYQASTTYMQAFEQLLNNPMGGI
jgi:hypothetical protein